MSVVKHRGEHKDLEDFVGDLRAKQQNLVWPEPWINATRVDQFLWKGSANPTLVQRIAAWLIGLALFFAGLVWFGIAIRGRASFLAVLFSVTFGCGGLLAGGKIFLNGFPKRR